MNKTFIGKMVQAKKLELEAFQELLPDEIKKRMKSWRTDAGDWLKECAVEIYLAGKREGGSHTEAWEESSGDKTETSDTEAGAGSAEKSEQRKRTKKVIIE